MRVMDSVCVQSTSLVLVAYDRHRDLLELHFRDGTAYRYFGVPAHTHQELLDADSKGGYFNRNIRGRFPYQPLHQEN